jgi:hypothetical protein
VQQAVYVAIPGHNEVSSVQKLGIVRPDELQTDEHMIGTYSVCPRKDSRIWWMRDCQLAWVAAEEHFTLIRPHQQIMS